jgi:hypothetical protein
MSEEEADFGEDNADLGGEEVEEEDEPLTPDEFEEIKRDNDVLIEGVEKAKSLIHEQKSDEALSILGELKTDCPICQGEIDDAKRKVLMIKDICIVEKTASDAKCQRMNQFIIDGLSDFVQTLKEATEELRDEAYSSETQQEAS